MATFIKGQRVRIKFSHNWPELAGKEGTVIGPTDCTTQGLTDERTSGYIVAPDCWGTHIAPHEGICGDRTWFGPLAEQLEPLYDGYQKTSWDALKDIWAPDHYYEKA
jgi:hypothetical protein